MNLSEQKKVSPTLPPINTLSIQRPLPSMLMRQPVALRTSSQPSLVNCEP